jgi:lycopene cyclase domain-containing protein
VLYFSGLEYTGLALAAFSLAVVSDRFLETYLMKRSLFLWLLGLIVVFTLIFNGYLTARPVVLYDYNFQLNLLVGTIPIEDFIYGLSLMYHVVVLYEWLQSKTSDFVTEKV